MTTYQTVEVALAELDNPREFEKLTSKVLLDRYPDLTWTGGPGDRGRDAVERVGLFGDEHVAVQCSIQKTWTAKLDDELDRYTDDESLPRHLIFVTPHAKSTTAIDKRIKLAAERGIELEVRGHGWLVPRLEGPYRHLAEEHLQVAPRAPARFRSAEAFRASMSETIPGFTASLVGLEDVAGRLANALGSNVPVVLLEGPGGTGKSRLASEVRPPDHELLVLTGRRFDREAAGGVPVHRPAVIVIDDAHRSDDLTGIRPMLDDEQGRWTQATVLLTARPGHTEQVLRETGLRPDEISSVPMPAITPDDIDQIVRNAPYRIADHPLRSAIVDVAGTNPLVAHLAAAAVRDGNLPARGLAGLLGEHLGRRLTHQHGPAHRRVLAAVALLGPLSHDRLGRLADVLPDTEPDPVGLLRDLADTGLVRDDGVSVAVKPDLLAVAVIAELCLPERTLDRVLDATDVFASVDRRHVRQLLERFARAVTMADGRGRDLLEELTSRRWPDAREQDTHRWVDALQEAAQVAQPLSGEVEALLSRFRTAWPTEPSATGLPDLRTGPDSALRAAVEAAAALDQFDAPETAVWELLDLCLLEGDGARDDEIRPRLADPVGRATQLAGLAVPERPALNVSRGRQILSTATQWLQINDGHPRAAGIAVATVAPLVGVLREFTRPAVASRRTIQWGSAVLSQQPHTVELTSDAARFIADRLPELDAIGYERVVELVDELRRHQHRGQLPQGGQLPAWAREVSADAGDILTAASVDVWSQLPVKIRFDLARADHPMSDRVASRVEADVQVRRLLAILPRPEGEWEERQARVEAAAVDLAHELFAEDGLPGAVEFLHLVDEVDQFSDGIAAFIEELGRLSGPADVAANLTKLIGSRNGRQWSSRFLHGVLDADGDSAATAVRTLAKHPQHAASVPSVLDDVPEDVERDLVPVLLSGPGEVLEALASHLARCKRLDPDRRARRLVDVAHRADDLKTVAATLSRFTPARRGGRVPMTDDVRDEVVGLLRQVLTDLTFDLQSVRPGLGPVFEALLEVDAKALAELLVDRAQTIAAAGRGGMGGSQVAPRRLEYVFERLDEAGRAAFVEVLSDELDRAQEDPPSAGTDQLWDLLRIAGASSQAHQEQLAAWAAGGAAERALALRGLRGMWGADLFEPVLQQLAARPLSDQEFNLLVDAAGLNHEVTAGWGSEQLRARADWFGELAANSDSVVLRRVAGRTAERFEMLADDADRRLRMFESRFD